MALGWQNQEMQTSCLIENEVRYVTDIFGAFVLVIDVHYISA